MLKLKSKKDTIATYHNLPQKVIASIPDMRSPEGPGKAVHDALALWEKLKSEKGRIMGELAHCTEAGPFGPATRYDAGADAAALLGGADVSTLTAPVAESRRAGLLRQLAAVEHALPGAETAVHRTAIAVNREVCQQLQPVVAEVVEDVLVQMESLLNELRDLAQLFQTLSHRGLSNRPAHWHLQAIEELILFGARGYPSLEVFIKERRKIWGIEPTK